MTESPRPLRIKQMQPRDIAAVLRRDPRLLLPVGTCESHGAHLPLGCDTIIVDRIVDDLYGYMVLLG
jgi:creatinine amidohydrolase/Fe(II)-dependent formamide hydrolase-like protein